MNDYADHLLKLNRLTKLFLNAILKNRKTEAYLIACEITETAQELEEWSSKNSVH
jgi:hypothetical protein